MMKKQTELKQKTLRELIELRKGTEFTDTEKKIWGKRPGIKHSSEKEEDYYQKVKEEDFLSRPIVIERSESLIKAEQKIENEIKKFENSMKTIMDPEDFNKLKKYRLIGNLISIKELKNSEDLFKSKEELYAAKSGSIPEPEEKKEEPQQEKEEITLEKIKEAGKAIVNKQYENYDDIKYDTNKLKNIIEKFKDEDPEAETKLKELDSMFSTIDSKLSNLQGNKEE
jgi:hypothetical protein